MEFGFRPIETPHSIISRSTGNLMTGGGPSASSIAHVAGAEAGVAAIKKPITKKLHHPDQIPSKEGWSNRYRIFSSLEDLQQVSRKPPLPVQSKLKTTNLRHATSEETIVKFER
ncbi:hypothetical protein Anas_12152 [Armadillidium nasatum]|nr:hypothetical protein Anas_12152 [Armadillidium nasatum]